MLARRFVSMGRRVGTGEFRCWRSVPVCMWLAGGLLPESMSVCKTAPMRRP